MFEILKSIKSLCTPAKIYLTIAFIVSIGALINGVDFIVIIVKMLFAGLWTYILNFMCKKGLKTLAWVIVLLPFVFMILVLFEFFHLTHEQKMYMREYGIEISYEEGFTEGIGLSLSKKEKKALNTANQVAKDPNKAAEKAGKKAGDGLLKMVKKEINKVVDKVVDKKVKKALNDSGCCGNDKKKIIYQK
jgi:c-di-AMP phosphodiesterase-like protein